MREMTGLTCEGCGKHGFVTVETRKAENAIRRRKRCAYCGYRVTTVEAIEPKLATVADEMRLPTG